jgi:hypothetical protein
MNKLIIHISISIAFSYSLKAQCGSTPLYDIYTPNGNIVVTLALCESSLQTRQAIVCYLFRMT